MKRFEFMAAQGGAMAYVLAKETRRNMHGYSKPPK